MIGNSVQIAPDYGHHRKDVVVADSGPFTDKNKGINCGGWGKAHVQVVPGATSNPTAHVLFWSEAAGKFIDLNPVLSVVGVGADTPHEFTVDVMGRIMFVALEGTVNEECQVFVSGYEAQHSA